MEKITNCGVIKSIELYLSEVRRKVKSSILKKFDIEDIIDIEIKCSLSWSVTLYVCILYGDFKSKIFEGKSIEELIKNIEEWE